MKMTKNLFWMTTQVCICVRITYVLTHIAVQHSLARKRRERLERKQGLESIMQISMLCWRTSIMKVCASHPQTSCMLVGQVHVQRHTCMQARVPTRAHARTRTARTFTHTHICLPCSLPSSRSHILHCCCGAFCISCAAFLLRLWVCNFLCALFLSFSPSLPSPADRSHSLHFLLYLSLTYFLLLFPPLSLSLCSFTAPYTCTRCGMRFCSTKCNNMHQETRCLKWAV